MNGSDIVSIIQNVGFPIVCCLVLFWIVRDDSKTRETQNDKFIEQLTTLTGAMQTLGVKLDDAGATIKENNALIKEAKESDKNVNAA